VIGVEENEGCKPDPIMRKMASGLQPSNVIYIIFPRACALGWYGAAPLALKDKKRPPEQLRQKNQIAIRSFLDSRSHGGTEDHGGHGGKTKTDWKDNRRVAVSP
jgi:hypothetical protein